MRLSKFVNFLIDFQMLSLQEAKMRKKIREEALLYRIEKSKQNKELTKNLIKHYWNVILNWTNELDIKSSTALQSFIALPINTSIPIDILNAWEVELTASGYYVDRYDHIFKVCLF